MLEFNTERCSACGKCVEACPVNALNQRDSSAIPRVDANSCIECVSCMRACPCDAISMVFNAPVPVPLEEPASLTTGRPSMSLIKIKQWLARPAVRRALAIGTPIALSFFKFLLERKLDRLARGAGTGKREPRSRRRRFRGPHSL